MPHTRPLPLVRRAAARLAVAGALLLASGAGAQTPTGDEIAQRIAGRPRAAQASRQLVLELHDSDGRVRERRLRHFRKLGPDAVRLVFAVESPPELEHDAFLAIDWQDTGRDDDQWLYRRSRKQAERIGDPARGQPFLGSDFSLEDMKREGRVEPGEFRWQNLGSEELDGRPHWLLEQTPATPELARSLGFTRAVSHVDAERWMQRRIRFYGDDGAVRKTFEFGDVRQVSGFWTATRIEATAEDGHRSVLRVLSVDFESPVPDEIFTLRAVEGERLGSRHPLPSAD